MIRPVTAATFLMALGSGLYLYQSKHEVQMLDRTIEHAVRETAAVRDQTRLLAIDYTVLTNQDRMRQLADAYLALKSIAPAQFTSLADLDLRLPAVVIPPPPAPAEAEPASVPMAAAGQGAPVPVTEPSAESNIGDDPPEPAIAPNAAPSGVQVGKTDAEEAPLPEPPAPPYSAPAPRSPAVAVARPAEHATERKAASRAVPADSARPAGVAESHVSRVAESRMPEPRPPEPRASESHTLVASRPPLQAAQKLAVATPALVLPQPVQAHANPAASVASPVASPGILPGPSSPATAPYTGSLLGMARVPVPAPRPVASPAPSGAINPN